MSAIPIAHVTVAHEEIVSLIQSIPDAALPCQPSDDEWSAKQIIGHLAHANGFYIMIVDEARATQFGRVKLHPDLVGWQHMVATDAAVAQFATTQDVLACFEHTYQRLLAAFNSITPQELDSPSSSYRGSQTPNR